MDEGDADSSRCDHKRGILVVDIRGIEPYDRTVESAAANCQIAAVQSVHIVFGGDIDGGHYVRSL